MEHSFRSEREQISSLRRRFLFPFRFREETINHGRVLRQYTAHGSDAFREDDVCPAYNPGRVRSSSRIVPWRTWHPSI